MIPMLTSLVRAFTGLLTAHPIIGTLIVALASFGSAFTLLLGPIRAVILSARLLFSGLGILFRVVMSGGLVIRALAVAVGLLTGPIGLTIAAVAALAAGLVLLWKNS